MVCPGPGPGARGWRKCVLVSRDTGQRVIGHRYISLVSFGHIVVT